MNYIAWSDGSIKNNKKYSKVAYTIHTKEGKLITQYKGKLGKGQLNDSAETEYYALYLLLKEIKRLEIDTKSLVIYMDANTIIDNFVRIKMPFKGKIINLYECIVKEIGIEFYEKVAPCIKWRTREDNLADAVLRSDLKAENINIDPLWREERKMNIVNSLIDIPDTSLKLPMSIFRKFHNGTMQMKEANEAKTLQLISEKIQKSMIIEETDRLICVKGRLQVYVKGNIVKKFSFIKSPLTEQYKKKKKEINLEYNRCLLKNL